MKRSAPTLLLLLLISGCFSLATILQPRIYHWSQRRDGDNVLKVLFGDGRRLFANHFFIKADVSFHSGYYPSIFDQAQAPKNSRHMTAKEGSAEAEEHERQMAFLGKPRDWIEAFGRHFMITEHTHLEGGGEREILPWLKLSAELDPQRIDTYTVASYWLRKELGKPREAEQFLREGIRNNPNSYELLFELGRLYHENCRDENHARGVWELALRRWREQEGHKEKPDLRGMEQITISLARLEEQAGHLERAISYLQMIVDWKAAPVPQYIQGQINELKNKLAAPGQPQAPKPSKPQ